MTKTATNQPMTSNVLFSLKSSGESLNLLKQVGEIGFNSKYRQVGQWDVRFFQFLQPSETPSQRVLDELKRDGLIFDFSDERDIHMTDKGVTYFRRCKM